MFIMLMFIPAILRRGINDIAVDSETCVFGLLIIILIVLQDSMLSRGGATWGTVGNSPSHSSQRSFYKSSKTDEKILGV